ncbi:MAG TPA: CTP synthase (glutamine hydrolyzing) [Candidatus Bipolaricaulota bacterium]
MKFIFVTGGVLSGLGKGIASASIALLLKSCGLRVTSIKIDPYLNCDAGTMSPYQHGEVFVLDDGSEVDMDLGNYERFLGASLSGAHNLTTGTIYRKVIERERRGDYLGATVQIIPHITDQIKADIKAVAQANAADVVVVELGGTVGDIESMPFLEAVRQMRRELGASNCLFVHATLVPVVSVVGEPKTKPTQHSVKELRAIGIQPDLIVARSQQTLSEETRRKISLFCDVDLGAVLSAPDARTIYEVPLILESQGVTDWIAQRLQLGALSPQLQGWRSFVQQVLEPSDHLEIAIVGKYTSLADSYVSYEEALSHAGAALGAGVSIRWVEAETFEEQAINGVDGVIVPVGFGPRGSEGKIQAIRCAREKKVPYLGICYGFQLAVIEFARHVLGLKGANSTEFEPNPAHPVIDLLPEQRDVKQLGGSMRLGSHPVAVASGTRAHQLYQQAVIHERHRHRFEVNPDYVERLESAGLHFTGRSQDGRRMEIAEYGDHPFFMAAQFHPEFLSRPNQPRPLFTGLIGACLKLQSER